VECPFIGYNDVSHGFDELCCIVDQGRRRNRGFSREKIRGVKAYLPPYKVPLSSPKPPDQPGQVSFKGGLPLIYASFLTGVQRITSVTWPISICDLCCSFVVTGGVHCVTGGVRVSFLGLSKRFIDTL
jgi:hypothetical protein